MAAEEGPAGAAAGPRARSGTVVAFDERRGLGEVLDAGSGERFNFHCTRIAGGGRRIAVGAAVVFEVGPGRPGCWEAVWLGEVVAPGGSPPPAVSPGPGDPDGSGR